MAITKYIHCPAYFWSFRGDHPPKGYCSVKCYEERRRQGRQAKTKPAPGLPQDVLARMYRHRLECHDSKSILADFDCRECDALEGIYADSLAYHQAAAEKAMRATPAEQEAAA